MPHAMPVGTQLLLRPREQPDERDHVPSRQIIDLTADMEPDADAPQDPPLDAKSAALTEESRSSADDDR